ncbi:hypothetical protein B5S33_g2103 [[Candida] boidinii]|nr:hypothetical protein B5S33_g2103 [[Candida] boidinii]
MPSDLNLKKSWNPKLLKNQEKVWKREQDALNEFKKIKQRQIEISQQREKLDLINLTRNGNHNNNNEEYDQEFVEPASAIVGNSTAADSDEFDLGKKRRRQVDDDHSVSSSFTQSQRSLDWMYKSVEDGGKKGGNVENDKNDDFLLGKRKLTDLIDSNNNTNQKSNENKDSDKSKDSNEKNTVIYRNSLNINETSKRLNSILSATSEKNETTGIKKQDKFSKDDPMMSYQMAKRHQEELINLRKRQMKERETGCDSSKNIVIGSHDDGTGHRENKRKIVSKDRSTSGHRSSHRSGHHSDSHRSSRHSDSHRSSHHSDSHRSIGDSRYYSGRHRSHKDKSHSSSHRSSRSNHSRDQKSDAPSSPRENHSGDIKPTHQDASNTK